MRALGRYDILIRVFDKGVGLGEVSEASQPKADGGGQS